MCINGVGFRCLAVKEREVKCMAQCGSRESTEKGKGKENERNKEKR